MSQEASALDVEAIKKHVYRLSAYDFRGGLGVNHLINVEAPALIAEVERLRAILQTRENIERYAISPPHNSQADQTR